MAEKKLLARLGSEVEDGIDELLSQSLQYETLEAPTLSGFLQWFVSGEVEIKRDMGKGNQIRVMTVHGSKGLESPIVILPDTGDKTLPLTSQITLSNNSAVWRSTGSDGSEIQAQAEAIIKEKQAKKKCGYYMLLLQEQKVGSLFVVRALIKETAVGIT